MTTTSPGKRRITKKCCRAESDNQKNVAEQSPTTKKQLNAVIHVGPHKTGSTSIQTASSLYIDLLKEDNYEMPWSYMNKNGLKNVNGKYLQKNQVNFASCFLPNDHLTATRFPCNPELLHFGLEIAKQEKDLFISAEDFAREEPVIQALANYL